MLEVLWLRLPGKTKTYQARAVINNFYATGWRLRNFNLRIKRLCASSFRNLEGKQKRGYRKFSFFLFGLVFFFFSMMPIFEIVSKKRADFWKEKQKPNRSNILCHPYIFFCFCCCCCFIRGILPALKGERKTLKKSIEKEEVSRSTDVSMYVPRTPLQMFTTILVP